MSNERISVWFARLRRATLRALYIAMWVVFAAAPAALVFLWAHEKDPTDASVWAMVIAALALAALTVLLFATGREQATAMKDVTYGPAGDQKTIRKGQRVPEEALKSLTEGQDYTLQRGVYLRALYVGKDGRWSTSKLQALLWTYAVLFGLASLIVAAWLGDEAGWEAQEELGLQGEYLVLLGGPFAAAVLSKAITTQKVEQGTLPKTEAQEPTNGVSEGLQQIVSDDTGDTDLVDTQYFLFNLLALGYFLGTFAFHLHQGFPTLPELLVGLTGVSAAAYVAKKATERGEPSLTSVFPSKGPKNEPVEVWGRNIVLRIDDPPSPPDVEVGGKPAEVTIASETRTEVDRVRVTIPDLTPGLVKIRAITQAGTPTNELEFEVE